MLCETYNLFKERSGTDGRIFLLKKGYNIKIAGRAERVLVELPEPDFVALQPNEFRGIKPKLTAMEGDIVKIGTPLFTDKANPDIKFVSPVSGTVDQINRGERRVLLEVVLKNDKKGTTEKIEAFSRDNIAKLEREQIIAQLLNGGMWPYLRQRPFNKIAYPADVQETYLFLRWIPHHLLLIQTIFFRAK